MSLDFQTAAQAPDSVARLPDTRIDSATVALQAMFTAAVSHHKKGALKAAEDLYQQILKIEPEQVDAWHLLGLVFAATGRAGRGRELIQKALDRQPKNPVFHSNLANILRREGKVIDALSHYHEALAIDPDFVDAHANIAGAYISAEMYPQAEAAARRALELDVNHVVALANLGGSLIAQSRFIEAAKFIDQSRSLGADNADVWLNSGYLRLSEGEFEAAEAAFFQALDRDPELTEAYRGLGFAQVRLRKISHAKSALESFIKRQPGPSSATSMLGHIEMNYGDFAAGAAMMAESVARPGASAAENSTYCFNLNYASMSLQATAKFSHEALAHQHRTWQERHAGFAAAPAVPKNPKPIRFGFVSPDLKAHSVSFFFKPLLEGLIERGIEVVCYSNLRQEDLVSEEIRNMATEWRPIWGVTDRDAASLIMNDKIDVLVDLAGHTAENRLQLFGLRPAPLQIAYLGYPNTTGLDTIDGRIVDIGTDPAEQTWLGSEELLRLDRCFLCFRPQAYPAIVDPPVCAGNPLTFGSFNNLSKINDDVIALWSRILQELPESRLMLKHDVSNDTWVQGKLLQSFANAGIAPERVVFRERMPTLDSHLEIYGDVDIALDPFPYNGTTTTCEALWMGVPVVTLLGDHHAARVSASILTTIGFDAGIAETPDEYVLSAVQLAQSPELLSSIRQMLRQSMTISPLGDGTGLTAAWYDAVCDLWAKKFEAELG